jgi:hypothetical protein
MSTPPTGPDNPDDFFPLGPEHEIPSQPGDFFPLGPEHEIPPQQGGTAPQWEGSIQIIKPDGEVIEQPIRVPREPGETAQDAWAKIAAAQEEIQRIIAERGGDYDVVAILSDITEI